jgi:uncharacterized membrane protein
MKRAELTVAITSGLWLIPSGIVLLFISLAFALTELDRHIDPEVRRDWPALMTSDADSAREMLSSISGAIITVAGVVFSITVVTLTLASTQYSSRAVRAFMRDRLSQVVLGAMAGTFAYCTAVLMMITGGEGEFVPSVAVFVGYLFATGAVFALIAFIHHVTKSIQAGNIIASIAAEATKAVQQTFATSRSLEQPAPTQANLEWQSIPSSRTGYIASVDIQALAAYARRRSAVVRMDRSAGDFVISGLPLISVLSQRTVEAHDADELNRAHRVGRLRTVDQDPDFGFRQIVDIALKALSPGVNDTTTAVVCVDHLAAALITAAGRWECGNVYDKGDLRVITRGPSFDGLVSKAFDQIRQNANGNVAVITALLNAIETLLPAVELEERRKPLIRQILAVSELIDRTVPSPHDRYDVERHLSRVAEKANVTLELTER